MLSGFRASSTCKHNEFRIIHINVCKVNIFFEEKLAYFFAKGKRISAGKHLHKCTVVYFESFDILTVQLAHRLWHSNCSIRRRGVFSEILLSSSCWIECFRIWFGMAIAHTQCVCPGCRTYGTYKKDLFSV